ncbi:hypothetical protein Bbelb_209000 [Branchiostoma belcheri]|nr:hypothetical protein Bbelb_209000 [Branchiostoma belcheri]
MPAASRRSAQEAKACWKSAGVFGVPCRPLREDSSLIKACVARENPASACDLEINQLPWQRGAVWEAVAACGEGDVPSRPFPIEHHKPRPCSIDRSRSNTISPALFYRPFPNEHRKPRPCSMELFAASQPSGTRGPFVCVRCTKTKRKINFTMYALHRAFVIKSIKQALKLLRLAHITNRPCENAEKSSPRTVRGRPSLPAPRSALSKRAHSLRPSYGVAFTRPSYGVASTRPSYGVAFTRPSYGVASTRPSYGVAFTRPSYGVAFTRPSYGVAFTRPSYGVAFTRPSYGVASTRPSYGVAFTRPSYGVASTRPSYGVAFTRPSYGVAFTRPSYGVASTRPSYGDPPARWRRYRPACPAGRTGDAGEPLVSNRLLRSLQRSLVETREPPPGLPTGANTEPDSDGWRGDIRADICGNELRVLTFVNNYCAFFRRRGKRKKRRREPGCRSEHQYRRQVSHPGPNPGLRVMYSGNPRLI